MRTHLGSTPAADGFSMPAEWDSHAGCYLARPENTYFWRQGAKPVPHAVAAIANSIVAVGDSVTVAVSPGQYRHARALLGALFPSRATVALPTRELLLGGGNIHCATSQVPEPVRGAAL